MISNAAISNANSIRVSVGGPDPAAGGLFGSTPTGVSPTDNLFAIREGLGADITAFPSTFFLFNAGGGANAAVDQPLFRSLFNPLGVGNAATVAAPGAASARAVDGAGNVTGATTAMDSGNVTVALDANGIPTVVSTDLTKVPAARAAQIQAAMRAFIRFVGNTINHEGAHGLGAVAPNDAGNQFNVSGTLVRSPLNGDNGAHNRVTANTNILDAGSARSFARRIENTGVQQVFNATNARYLADVVPHDPKDN